MRVDSGAGSTGGWPESRDVADTGGACVPGTRGGAVGPRRSRRKPQTRRAPLDRESGEWSGGRRGPPATLTKATRDLWLRECSERRAAMATSLSPPRRTRFGSGSSGAAGSFPPRPFGLLAILAHFARAAQPTVQGPRGRPSRFDSRGASAVVIFLLGRRLDWLLGRRGDARAISPGGRDRLGFSARVDLAEPWATPPSAAVPGGTWVSRHS